MSGVQNKSPLYYVAKGEGPAVVLIHGVAASLHDWEAFIPTLAEAGYRALAVDLPGHGESVKPDAPEHYSASTIYKTLENWIHQLKDSPPYILIGHSLGGHLCLTFALRHPEQVRAMALIDPFYSPKQLSPLLRFLNRRPALGAKALQSSPLWLIDTILGWDPINTTRFTPEIRWQVAIDYKRASPHILNIPRTTPDLSSELRHIQIPTLVIWGEKDLTLNPDSFPALISALPNAEGYPIPGCGHQPHIGQPDLVNRSILEFIQHTNLDERVEPMRTGMANRNS